MEEIKQYIDFNEIKQYVNVKDEKLFLLYLREIYKDLSDRDESNKKKGILKMIFFDYIKLPIFISEKLFNSFASSSQQEGLKEEEFVSGFFKLYMGSFSE